MNTHYLPRWLLKRFRGATLFQLDVMTGKIESRSIENAGSGDDLWPGDIETGVMKPPDNKAAQIFRKKIAGHDGASAGVPVTDDEIVLTEVEQKDFAVWLTLFLPRVPKALKDLETLAAKVRDDPGFAMSLVYQHPEAIVEQVKTDNPEFYNKAVADLGKVEAEAVFLGAIIDRTKPSDWPTPQFAYEFHLRKRDFEPIAGVLIHKFQWVWLRSREPLVIGDNPFCRVEKATGELSGPIRRMTEITMPLSSQLCLLLEPPHREYAPHVIECPSEDTRRLNLRQRFAATKYVYAGDEAVLASLRQAERPSPKRM